VDVAESLFWRAAAAGLSKHLRQAKQGPEKGNAWPQATWGMLAKYE
jgi:hypothetical protein